MLELHQFQHSTFCLKVRMALKAKNLSFRIVEISPGLEQINLFRISGQKQVPILKDGDHIISESSAIIKYLETISTEPELLPKENKEATNE